jgi:hypothetical protein
VNKYVIVLFLLRAPDGHPAVLRSSLACSSKAPDTAATVRRPTWYWSAFDTGSGRRRKLSG